VGNPEIGNSTRAQQLGKGKPHILYLASPFIAASTTRVPLLPKLSRRRWRCRVAFPKAVQKMKDSERKGPVSQYHSKLVSSQSPLLLPYARSFMLQHPKE